MRGFSFHDLCRMLGKDAFHVKNLQRGLDLHVPAGARGYTQAYVIFMEKIVALRAFQVPIEDIKHVFDLELKILRLQHVDTLSASPTWYLDGCVGAEDDELADRLLLTGWNLGFPVDAQAIQHTLDFGPRDPELFDGAEMGEDLRRVLRRYRGLAQKLIDRVAREKPVLENALHWARGVLRNGAPAGRRG